MTSLLFNLSWALQITVSLCFAHNNCHYTKTKIAANASSPLDPTELKNKPAMMNFPLITPIHLNSTHHAFYNNGVTCYGKRWIHIHKVTANPLQDLSSHSGPAEDSACLGCDTCCWTRDFCHLEDKHLLHLQWSSTSSRTAWLMKTKASQSFTMSGITHLIAWCHNPGALNPQLIPRYKLKVSHIHSISKDMECITEISIPYLTSLEPWTFIALR